MWASMAAVDDISRRLVAAVEGTLPAWVERSVRRRLYDWSGSAGPVVMAEAVAAGQQASEEVGAELRRLLETDIDEQWTNPLSILRAAVRYPTEVLRRARVPPVARDAYDEAHFPDDDYDLVPRSFADVDPSLHEPGLAWGAAKAYAHLARRGQTR
ncbi:MAG: hypothetical protein M3N37_08895 [Actinomycetota bacterium]|nr:hypothetical protein [Actinomycetota bacterium]